MSEILEFEVTGSESEYRDFVYNSPIFRDFKKYIESRERSIQNELVGSSDIHTVFRAQGAYVNNKDIEMFFEEILMEFGEKLDNDNTNA